MKPSVLILKLLPTLLLVALPTVGRALDYTYTSDGSAITITRYTGTNNIITIPDAISGLPVTTIATEAFRSDSLTSITVPHSVTTIERLAFYYCDALTSVSIGRGVTSIEINVFTTCGSLVNITVDGANSTYSTQDGVLFNKSKSTLIQYPRNNSESYSIPSGVTTIDNTAFSKCNLSDIMIPNTVATIGKSTFSYCSNLSDITIPDSTTIIGRKAFFACDNLANVIIGNSVTNIGDSTFENCNNLSNITIGSSVFTIGERVFWYCTNLTSITIPDSTTIIGRTAFYACQNLTHVTLGNSVATIGESAFTSCKSLTNITIPASVTSIGALSFYGCSNLTEITVDEANLVFSSQNGVLFNKARTSLIQCPANKTGSYSIPSGVTNIVAGAFNPCLLTNITIPDSVISIGNSAFRDSPNLTSIIIPNSVISTGTAIFMDCVSLTDVIIGNGISTIEQSMFNDCGILTNITFGNSVSTFGWSAFGSCLSLKTAYFKGNAPNDDPEFPNGRVTCYYLPGKLGWDATYKGNSTKLWIPRIEFNTENSEADSNQFGFNINWASGQDVLIEARETLISAVWETLQTNTLSADSVYFSDAQSTNHPARFYRLRMP